MQLDDRRAQMRTVIRGSGSDRQSIHPIAPFGFILIFKRLGATRNDCAFPG
jgi:hypothetical protein